MRKLIALLLALVCVFAFAGCSTTVEGKSVLLKEGNIESISVSTLPESDEYIFADVDADKIINYISELKLTSFFSENPDDYVGRAWVISLEYEDGNVLTIYHFGMFIRTEDSPWYKMNYEEANQIGSLVSELSAQ